MRRAHRLLAPLLLIGLLIYACESKSSWEGRYVGPPGKGLAGTVALTLQAGGKGQWTAEQESTSLRWEERNGAIWLHLKNGGVMVAKPIPALQAVAVDLPGVGALTLRKTQP
jgi:hypothetical protein